MSDPIYKPNTYLVYLDDGSSTEFTINTGTEAEDSETMLTYVRSRADFKYIILKPRGTV